MLAGRVEDVKRITQPALQEDQGAVKNNLDCGGGAIVAEMDLEEPLRMNLLRFRPLRNLLKSWWFPLAAQVVLLVAFALIIWRGFGIHAPDPAFAKVLRNTNLANLLVWAYWWPLVIVGAVLFGRVWCTVCPNDNLRLSVRRPFADFFQPLGLTVAQVGFVLVVSGFVVYEVLSEWAPSKAVVKWAPNQVVAALGLAGPAAGLAGAVVMFVVFPAVIFLVVIVLARLLGRTPPAASAKALALMLLPTMAGAHLIKAAFKMTSRLPYWPIVVTDTSGVETANRIAAGTLVVNKSLPQSLQPVTTALAAVVLVASLVVVLAMVRRQASVSRLPVRIRAAILAGALAYWAIFAVTIGLWRF